MKWFDLSRIGVVFSQVAAGLLAMIPFGPAAALGAEGVPPVADAGLPRYAAREPVVLDGTGSYDPDDSGPLSYQWRQVGGPAVAVADGDTATPTIFGFLQTDAIQECEFELVVSDGELLSRSDTVKVIIVPAFGAKLPELTSDSFDPNKPTVIVFRGGDGTNGFPVGDADDQFRQLGWVNVANVIEFRAGYAPDSGSSPPTYYACGDMIIVYLSSVAPHYSQPIQAIGASTGGMPAMDVGLRLNLTYKDRRYTVNRVTYHDVGERGKPAEFALVDRLVANPVDGEQCWVDAYDTGWLWPNALSVYCPSLSHFDVRPWYTESLTSPDMNQFNHGVVAGAFWSVIGPGKNLQLASTPGSSTYLFRWYGSRQSGHIDLHEESQYPGRLPEPVTLVGPPDGATVNSDGAVLTCEESENAVGYQLLFGADPYRMVYLYSDTPAPPDTRIAAFPFQETWWTVKAYDQYGSTIHADPINIKAEIVEPQTIENLTIGRAYASIQQAVNDAQSGDEIVIGAGLCQYQENIDFKGKNLTLRSTNPDDPDVVATTIINGGPLRAVITMSGSLDGNCVLAGLTITGGTVGIVCQDAAPTITDCIVESEGATAIEFWCDYEPTLVDCTVLGAVESLNDPTLLAHWALDETQGIIASDSAGDYDGTMIGVPAWQPDAGAIGGALKFNGMTFVVTHFVIGPSDGPFSVFAWVKGGAAGEAVVSQQGGANWLMADALHGSLATELKSSSRLSAALSSEVIVTDSDWHRVGFTWDGSNRRLYVDDVLAAEDTHDGLAGSSGKVLIGCGGKMTPGAFFTGLIDDVRIYNRAVKP